MYPFKKKFHRVIKIGGSKKQPEELKKKIESPLPVPAVLETANAKGF
jgi:hypothetical protein